MLTSVEDIQHGWLLKVGFGDYCRKDNFQVFARAIHCLAKIGDEIYFEPLKKGLSLRTVNSSRSAYACFIFMKTFFQTYDDGFSGDQDEASADQGLKCKLSVKSCLSVFKSLSTIERIVDRCSIKMNDREEQLTFLLYCRHGITKTYNLAYQDCESLQAVFTRDLSPNLINVQPRLLNEVVMNFQNTQEEITLTVCPQTMKVTNYLDEDQEPEKVINTEMILVAEEFEQFQIGVDSEVTFCLKELKGVIAFAESSEQNIDIHFESGGKPIVFSLASNPTFEANFVLATIMDLPGSQISQHTNGKAEKKKRSNKTKDTSRPSTSPAGIVVEDDEFGLHQEDEDDWENDVIAAEAQLAQETSKKNNGNKSTEDGDSFPNQDVLPKKTISKKSSQSHTTKTNQSSSVKRAQTPPSSVPADFSAQKYADMPVFGGSLSADSENSPQIAVRSGKYKTQKHIEENVLVDEEQSQDTIPGTPPSKKFKSMLFSAMWGNQSFRNQTIAKQNETAVLAADTDDESD